MFKKMNTKACLIVCIIALSWSNAGAVTLKQSMKWALENNPKWKAAEAEFRATKENIAIARGNRLFKVNANADAAHTENRTKTATPVDSRNANTGGVGLEIAQPIYQGGQLLNAQKKAGEDVAAARAALELTEQAILLEAVEAHTALAASIIALSVQSKNVASSQKAYTDAKARFSVGEGTQTDMAISEARYQAARAGLAASKANLEAAKAEYKRVTGVDAAKADLANPLSAYIPKSKQTALEMARAGNPAIRSARASVTSAEHSIAIAKGALLPSFQVKGTLSRRFNPTATIDVSDSSAIIGSLQIPIFQGGGEYARIRQSKETASQKKLELSATHDVTTANVEATWSFVEAAKAQLQASAAEVNASLKAYKSAQEEVKAGERTTLDLLITQQDYLNAQLNQIVAKQSIIDQSAKLLFSIGKLSGSALRL